MGRGHGVEAPIDGNVVSLWLLEFALLTRWNPPCLSSPPAATRCLPGAERYRRAVLAAWQEAKARVESGTGLPIPMSVSVTLCRGRTQFQRTVRGAPNWAGAVALTHERSIVINGEAWSQLGATAGCTLAHELSHLALAAATAGAGRIFPKWFDEGLACWVSGASHLGDLDKLDLAAAFNGLPTLASLSTRFPARERDVILAYLTSERFVAYLALRFGDGAVRGLVAKTLETMSFKRAFEDVFRQPVEAVELQWHKGLKESNPSGWALLRSLNAFAVMTFLVILAFVIMKLRNRRIRRTWDHEGFGF